MVRAVSFGQRLSLADLYWLRTVMYVGEGTLPPKRGWEALYPLAEIVTDLDPRFGYAYQVIGSNLTGLAGKVEQSNRLLEKGMRNVPDRWLLPFVYATNKFFYEHDYATAAQYARRAAEIGKRPHLALLAANLSALANTDDEYEAAAAFLVQMLRQQTSSPSCGRSSRPASSASAPTRRWPRWSRPSPPSGPGPAGCRRGSRELVPAGCSPPSPPTRRAASSSTIPPPARCAPRSAPARRCA